MKGLIYKEICMFKIQFKSWLFAFAILGVYAAVLKSPYFINTMTAVFGLMTCLTTFSYDKMYRCDEYICSMPVSRKKIVLSKYLFLLLIDLSITVFSLAAALIFNQFFKEDVTELFLASAGVLAATMLLQMIAMPVLYKWGPDKGRILFTVLAISPFLLLMVFKDHMPGQVDEAVFFHLLQAAPFLMILILVVSVMLSIGIYKKKEF